MPEPAHQSPPAFESGFFPASDGVRLYGHWTAPEGGAARAGLLILHGYAEHGGRYREVARHLASQGYGVLAVDFRGHGQAEGARGHCDAFEEYLLDLDAALAQLRTATGDAPIGLIGHSHGGLIALRALSEPGRLRDIRAAVLSSPYLGLAMKVPVWKTLAGRLASRLVPRLAMPNGIQGRDLTHDQALVAEHDADRLNHTVATARWFVEAEKAQTYVLENVHRVSVPTLWLVAGDDRLADREVTRRAYEQAGGDKTIRMYDGLYHELFNEIDRTSIYETTSGWLSSYFPVG